MRRSMIMTALSAAAMLGIAGTALAETAYVGTIGDQDWYSADTRSGTGVNVVGLNYTRGAVSNPPGPGPSAADDLTIASRFTFVPGPAGSFRGALHMAHPDALSIKSSISVINTDTGLATGSWEQGFSAEWRRYHTGGTPRATNLTIGVQSTLWADSQLLANFTNGTGAKYSGEPVWDLGLVNQQGNVDDTWVTYQVDGSTNLTLNNGASQNNFKIATQAGNNFFSAPPSGYRTLDQWAHATELARPGHTWAEVLFGPSAKVTQFGFLAGSGAGEANEYMDWVQTSMLNGGDRVEFVPEPGTLVLLVTAGLVALAVAWRRHQR